MYRKRRRVRVYHEMDNDSADQKNREKEKTMINAMMGKA